jgi:SAM-dependent methyltransferase
MHAVHWSEMVHVVGVDLDRERLSEARNGFRELGETDRETWYLGQSNALKLPFRTDQFDTVICSEVLEHLPDYETALEEIDRVLKPAGELAVSVPRSGPERICWWLSEEYHQVAGGHVRIFDERTLRNQIESTGFAFEGQEYRHALHSPFWWLKCLFWDDEDNSRLIDLYNRFLEWDLTENPAWLRTLERNLLDPLFGKSSVMYFSRGND